MPPKYILWDPKDGPAPRQDEDGTYLSDGILGKMTAENVYLRSYASYPKGSKPLADLEVGEAIHGVSYSLSGGHGVYDVYRVS